MRAQGTTTSNVGSRENVVQGFRREHCDRPAIELLFSRSFHPSLNLPRDLTEPGPKLSEKYLGGAFGPPLDSGTSIRSLSRNAAVHPPSA